MVQERDPTVYETLRVLTARDRKVDGTERVAIIIHSPSNRSAGSEHKRNEKKRCKDVCRPFFS
jgi:hypothetical protein